MAKVRTPVPSGEKNNSNSAPGGTKHKKTKGREKKRGKYLTEKKRKVRAHKQTVPFELSEAFHGNSPLTWSMHMEQLNAEKQLTRLHRSRVDGHSPECEVSGPMKQVSLHRRDTIFYNCFNQGSAFF